MLCLATAVFLFHLLLVLTNYCGSKGLQEKCQFPALELWAALTAATGMLFYGSDALLNARSFIGQILGGFECFCALLLSFALWNKANGRKWEVEEWYQEAGVWNVVTAFLRYPSRKSFTYVAVPRDDADSSNDAWIPFFSGFTRVVPKRSSAWHPSLSRTSAVARRCLR